MNNYLIYAIGFIAQIGFGMRLLVQMFLSEKHKKSLSPTVFWVISLVSAFIMIIYASLRLDLAILVGQIVTYYIYIINLDLKGWWQKLSRIWRTVVILTPAIGILSILRLGGFNLGDIICHPNISTSWLMLGLSGTVLFNFRFVYQVIYSVKRNESILPMGFWVISMIGTILLITYAIYRRDPVILLGQSLGLFIYVRNAMLILRSKYET
nr:hypothetical protein [Candidatus Cloacimonadota bacterium]